MPLGSPPPASDPREVRRFVRELDRRLEPIDRGILVADWNLFTGRSSHGSDALQLRRARLLSDPRLLGWVRSARGRTGSGDDARRLELLERILIDTQVEQAEEIVRLRGELQRTIVAFRPRWHGRRVNREVVFRAERESSRRAERRAAYYAYEPLHRPLEEGLRELVRLRNDRARALGYRTFAHLRLSFDGLSPERLQDLVDATAPTAARRLRELRDRFLDATDASEWFPWDFSYARESRVRLPARAFPQRGMLERVLRAIAGWGFPVQRLRFRVVHHDCTVGGLTLAPDPPRDVRILLHPAGGWLAHMILFHEVGHAVHSASIRSPRHLLRWHENVPGFGAFHEGIGSLFEEIPNLASWLGGQSGIDRATAEAFEAVGWDGNALAAGANIGWYAIEQALYRDPDRDPMATADRLARRLFGYGSYRPRSFVDSFFVDSPIYAPNYFLAILFGRQVARAITERCGEPLWPNRRVGPWLTRSWFAPGSRIDWLSRVREVTGRPFGARAFCDAFRARDG